MNIKPKGWARISEEDEGLPSLIRDVTDSEMRALAERYGVPAEELFAVMDGENSGDTYRLKLRHDAPEPDAMDIAEIPALYPLSGVMPGGPMLLNLHRRRVTYIVAVVASRCWFYVKRKESTSTESEVWERVAKMLNDQLDSDYSAKRLQNMIAEVGGSMAAHKRLLKLLI